MNYNQLRLVQGNRIMTCWVAWNPAVHEGVRLTLKGVAGEWTVEKVYRTLLPAPPDKSYRVGGLF